MDLVYVESLNVNIAKLNNMHPTLHDFVHSNV